VQGALRERLRNSHHGHDWAGDWGQEWDRGRDHGQDYGQNQGEGARPDGDDEPRDRASGDDDQGGSGVSGWVRG
jgi:hypothetical protein